MMTRSHQKGADSASLDALGVGRIGSDADVDEIAPFERTIERMLVLKAPAGDLGPGWGYLDVPNERANDEPVMLELFCNRATEQSVRPYY
jgi:hypothetical protein